MKVQIRSKAVPNRLSFSFIFISVFLVCAITSQSTEWPVYFEKLGFVHSIHNKWDLALRVHIDLPSLDRRLMKLAHRLTILDTNFHDPDALPDQTTSKYRPSRLDDLNRSWKDQNAHLRKRCEILLRRARDLRELGQNLSLRRRRSHEAKKGAESLHDRQKRQTVGEGILKSMFGVAYTNDVHEVKTLVNGVDTRLSSSINGVRSLTNSLKTSAEAMLRQHETELTHVESMARSLERKVINMETNPFMKTSISDLVHVRNEAYKKIALEVDLADERLVEIESIVTALGSGRLSKSVISPTKIRETLFSIEEQLPANFSLLYTSEEALWPYYSVLGTSAIFDSSLADVVVTISIPLVDQSSILDLNRVHNLPLKVKDGYSVIADIDTEYLVTDKSKRYFLELFKEDFQDCQVFHTDQGEQFYCGLQPMLRADMARSCVMQLYQGLPDPAWCQSRLKHGLVQPFTRLYNGSWIFAALNDQVPVRLECPEEVTPTGLVGFGVIHLAEGCTITSDEFWYAHTQSRMMEINIRFGKEFDEMDSEDDKKDPEDYDINNFQDDVMFSESNDVLEAVVVGSDESSTASLTNSSASPTSTSTLSSTESEELAATETIGTPGDTTIQTTIPSESSSSSSSVSSSAASSTTMASDGSETTPVSIVDDEEEVDDEAEAVEDVELPDPKTQNDATTIYKDIIVKLKDTFNSRWVLARK